MADPENEAVTQATSTIAPPPPPSPPPFAARTVLHDDTADYLARNCPHVQLARPRALRERTDALPGLVHPAVAIAFILDAADDATRLRGLGLCAVHEPSGDLQGPGLRMLCRADVYAVALVSHRGGAPRLADRVGCYVNKVVHLSASELDAARSRRELIELVAPKLHLHRPPPKYQFP